MEYIFQGFQICTNVSPNGVLFESIAMPQDAFFVKDEDLEEARLFVERNYKDKYIRIFQFGDLLVTISFSDTMERTVAFRHQNWSADSGFTLYGHDQIGIFVIAMNRQEAA